MTDAEGEARSIVEARHHAWTGGDVDRALTPAPEDVRSALDRLGHVPGRQQPA